MYRLLVADDDMNEREGIQFLIRKLQLPLKVDTASNGKQALERLSEAHYDILLTDIKMPFMNGLDLAEQAKALKPALKIIILSGHGEFEYAKRAILINVAQYMLKPIEPDEFEASLNRVIKSCREDEQRDRMLRGLAPARDRASAEEEASAPREGTGDTEQRRAVEEVIRLIEREYDQDLSLEYLARKVHLSGSYLSHIFKKATGTSVVKYINGYRMEKAKAFLCEENYKIVDIYRMVGFSDASYFGMAFKNHFGVTPTQFRAMARPE